MPIIYGHLNVLMTESCVCKQVNSKQRLQEDRETMKEKGLLYIYPLAELIHCIFNFTNGSIV